MAHFTLGLVGEPVGEPDRLGGARDSCSPTTIHSFGGLVVFSDKARTG
jgi:hypothetical protein